MRRVMFTGRRGVRATVTEIPDAPDARLRSGWQDAIANKVHTVGVAKVVVHFTSGERWEYERSQP